MQLAEQDQEMAGEWAIRRRPAEESFAWWRTDGPVVDDDGAARFGTPGLGHAVRTLLNDAARESRQKRRLVAPVPQAIGGFCG